MIAPARSISSARDPDLDHGGRPVCAPRGRRGVSIAAREFALVMAVMEAAFAGRLDLSLAPGRTTPQETAA